MVEESYHSINVLLCHRIKPAALWKVLSEQTIGVFVGAAFPRMVRVGKENGHLELSFNQFKFTCFRTIVISAGKPLFLWHFLKTFNSRLLETDAVVLF